MSEEEVERQRKALERSETFFRTKKFSHTEKTRKLCPEAVGHFCMCWGDHGQGGFNSVSGGYSQGGQPMDKDFARWADLIDCYEAFEKAKETKDKEGMRAAVRDLKEARDFHSIDKKDERPFREDPYEEKKPSRKRKALKVNLNAFAKKIFLKNKRRSLLIIGLIAYLIKPTFLIGVIKFLSGSLFLLLSYWVPVFYALKFFGKKFNGMWGFLWTMFGWPLMMIGFFKLLERLKLFEQFIDWFNHWG